MIVIIVFTVKKISFHFFYIYYPGSRMQ